MLINKKIRCTFCFSGLKAEQVEKTQTTTYIDTEGKTYRLKGSSYYHVDIYCNYNPEHKLPTRLSHVARRILAQGGLHEAY